MRPLLQLALALVLATPLGAATDSDALLARLRPQGYVSDFAGAFAPRERAELERFLDGFERQTGVEIAVVALPSIEDGAIDDFASRLFERWGIGKRGKDNGVLLLAALEDRRARIEVGYGLEGVLPDARTGRVLDEHVLPLFRQDAHAAGLTAGAQELAQIVARDAGITLRGQPPQRVRREQPPRRGIGLLRILLLIIMIPVIIRHPWLLLLLLNSGRGGYRGGGFGGGGFSGGFGGFGGGLSGGGGASRGW